VTSSLPDRIPADQARLAEPLRSRWSPSVLDPTHVLGDDEIALLLEAARWAPSCGNAQPAHLLVCRRGDEAHQVLVRHLSRGNAGWVPRASVVFLVGAQVAPDEEGEGGYKPFHADYDTGQAAAHLTLQAVASGLATHQFAGFDRDALAAELGVPDHVRLLAGIAVGVPGDAPDGDTDDDTDEATERDRERESKPRRRRPLDRTAYAGRWGRPWRGSNLTP
jgi:nitroreductase